MLRRPAKVEPEPPKREPFTYVHRGTTVIGELRAEGRVRVHGTVLGTVKVRGVLEVAESGVVEGALVAAEELKVLGRVVADVRVTGKVEIWKGGHLVGDVRARALDIEEGALFSGRSEMIGEDGKAIAVPSSFDQAPEALPGAESAQALELPATAVPDVPPTTVPTATGDAVAAWEEDARAGSANEE